MKSLLVIGRYAHSLIHTVPVERYDVLLADATELQRRLEESPEFIKLLHSRLFAAQKKRELMTELLIGLSFGTIWHNLLTVLEKNRRIPCLLKVIDQIEAFVQHKQGKRRVKLTLARDNDEAVTNKIKSYIHTIVGKDLVISTEIDPSILGGFIAKVESISIDGSIKNNLDQFKRLSNQ